MVVHLKVLFPMNRKLGLSAISGKEQQILHFMVLFLHRAQAKESRAPVTFGIFDLVCFSQQRLLVEVHLFSCLVVRL